MTTGVSKGEDDDVILVRASADWVDGLGLSRDLSDRPISDIDSKNEGGEFTGHVPLSRENHRKKHKFNDSLALSEFVALCHYQRSQPCDSQ